MMGAIGANVSVHTSPSSSRAYCLPCESQPGLLNAKMPPTGWYRLRRERLGSIAVLTIVWRNDAQRSSVRMPPERLHRIM